MDSKKLLLAGAALGLLAACSVATYPPGRSCDRGGPPPWAPAYGYRRKVCGVCGAEYQYETAFCPHDGYRLDEVVVAQGGNGPAHSHADSGDEHANAGHASHDHAPGTQTDPDAPGRERREEAAQPADPPAREHREDRADADPASDGNARERRRDPADRGDENRTERRPSEGREERAPR